MPRKLIKQFQGAIFFPNHDFINEYLNNKDELYKNEYYWNIKKFNLIKDSDNNISYLIGDYEGDEYEYACSIKLFLYNDKKVLGHINYVAESGWENCKIEAKQIVKKNIRTIYGICTEGKDFTKKYGFLAKIY